jgi:hypothetical protein
MGLINYDRLLSTLLSQEQYLADELLSLSQQENACCESKDTDHLIDIVVERQEVMSALERHHEQTLAVARSAALSDEQLSPELQNAIKRLHETIEAIQSQEQLTLEKLTQKTDPDFERLQGVKQASQWPQYTNQSGPSFEADSRK